MWMYDRFSLSLLFRNVGLDKIVIKDPYLSDIHSL